MIVSIKKSLLFCVSAAEFLREISASVSAKSVEQKSLRSARTQSSDSRRSRVENASGTQKCRSHSIETLRPGKFKPRGHRSENGSQHLNHILVVEEQESIGEEPPLVDPQSFCVSLAEDLLGIKCDGERADILD